MGLFPRSGILGLSFWVCGLGAAPDWGWVDIGHGAVGYIAEKHLAPQGRALVHEILGIEPLAVAAAWPDHVRSDKRFDAFAPSTTSRSRSA